MKIYINKESDEHELVAALVNRLKTEEHEVVHRLVAGIDVLVCFDPRPSTRGESGEDIIKYRDANEGSRLISRVDDAGSHGKKKLTEMLWNQLPKANRLVFPSHWALAYLCTSAIHAARPEDAAKIASKEFDIIPNGPMSVFYDHRSDIEVLDDDKKIKVVTHHWSNNPKKGFELYKEFDELEDFEFTYIGRTPADTKFKNHIEPMSAVELAVELPKHDVYLTASMEEAGANHVLEALAVGLPVVYSNTGGSIVEYCAPYGVNFDGWDLQEAKSGVERIAAEYDVFKQAALMYDNRVEDVAEKYLELITK